MHIPEDSTPQEGSPTQVQQLIRLLQTGEQANIELALQLAEGLGNPAAFQAYLHDLLPLYQLAFKSKRQKPLDAPSMVKLFQLTKLEVRRRKLSILPENISQLINLQVLDCSDNQLPALPESIGQLQKLKVFNCSFNQLQTLPESITQLQMQIKS